jgi:hypothetical protein
VPRGVSFSRLRRGQAAGRRVFLAFSSRENHASAVSKVDARRAAGCGIFPRASPTSNEKHETQKQPWWTTSRGVFVTGGGAPAPQNNEKSQCSIQAPCEPQHSHRSAGVAVGLESRQKSSPVVFFEGEGFLLQAGIRKEGNKTSVRLQLNRARAPERRPEPFAAAAAASVLLRLAGSLGFRSRPLSHKPCSSCSTGKRRHGSGRGRTKKATSVGVLARSRFGRAAKASACQCDGVSPRGLESHRGRCRLAARVVVIDGERGAVAAATPQPGRGRQEEPRSRQHCWCTAETRGFPPGITRSNWNDARKISVAPAQR